MQGQNFTVRIYSKCGAHGARGAVFRDIGISFILHL